MIQIVVLLFRR